MPSALSRPDTSQVRRRDLANAKRARLLDEALELENTLFGIGERAGIPEPKNIRDFFKLASPEMRAPEHLSPILDIADRIIQGDPIKACVSVPPQHGKSTTLLHLILFIALFRPNSKILYATYSATLTTSQRKRSLDILIGLCNRQPEFKNLIGDLTARTTTGTQLNNQFTLSLLNGSEIYWRSVEGACTGLTGDIVVCDDLFQGYNEALSPSIRDKVWDWFTTEAITRMHSKSSLITNFTRWSQDDVIGRLQKIPDSPYQFINLPAITDTEDGPKPLWEEKHSLAHLLEIKLTQKSELKWSAVYQGCPTSGKEQVFQAEPQYFTELPITKLPDGYEPNYSYSIGVDFAYSEKKGADYSVAIAFAWDWANQRGYILDMIRERESADKFGPRLKGFQDKWKGSTVEADIGGTEQGTISFMSREYGIKFRTRPVSQTTKLTRSMPVANRWNQQAIYLPNNATWTHEVVLELNAFTGTGLEEHDDIPDALSSAFHPFKIGRKRNIYAQSNFLGLW